MKIILDNGHGKNTPGKRSPVWSDGSQLFEYEFNRDIVRRINKAIPGTIILVPELNDISLQERCSRANAITHASKEPVLLISVHANAGKGTGWEVWTSKGETLSDKYATKMYNEMKRALSGKFPLRSDSSDGDPDKESQFYILKNTYCSAILTENMFMDTRNDCRFIMSEAGRKLIADAHINFIKSIL